MSLYIPVPRILGTSLCNNTQSALAKGQLPLHYTRERELSRFARMATSCESHRTTAYSDNLHWKMVYQAKALGKSFREIPANLNVDTSTVSRTVALFEATNDVRPRDYPPNPGTAKLTEIDKLIVLELAIEKPGIYLREIQAQLTEETGTEVDINTTCRFLHSSGFTRQKLQVTAKQRSDELRVCYLMDVQVYSGHPEMLVFVDETGR